MSNFEGQRFPLTRLRRTRLSASLRRLVAETSLTASNLVYPVFVIGDDERTEAIASMPGIRRLGLGPLLEEAKLAVSLGIPAIALFPVVGAGDKSPNGEACANPDGLVQRTVRAIKKQLPDLTVITDVALDPYTTHGQDGILDGSGYVMNDETVGMLVRQAASPVRWVETIRRMRDMGVTHVIECGPGKVLAGMTRRIWPEAQSLALADRDSLEQALKC